MATAFTANPDSNWQDSGLSELARAVMLHLDNRPEEAYAEAAAAGPGDTASESAMAHLAFETGRYGDSAQHFARVVEAQPQSQTALFGLALSLEKTGRPQEAGACFERILSADPSRLEARLGLAICQLHRDLPELALENFERCLASDADNPTALFGTAVAFQLTGRLDEAIAVYEKVLARDPASCDALINLVAVGVAKQDLALIRSASERLLVLDADSPGALEGLAACAFGESDWPAAARYCQRLADGPSATWEHCFNLGVACWRLGRTGEAVHAFQQVVQRSPSCRQAWVNLGAIWQENGDLRSAREAYEQALSLSPDMPEVLYNLATIAEAQGSREEAERLYTRVAAQKGEAAEEAWFRLGFLRLQKGDMRGAIDAFNTCLHHRPNWTSAGVNLAIALWRSGEKDAAARRFELVIASEPEAVDAVRGLAALSIERSDFDRALDLQAKLIHLGQSSPELLFNTGLLLQRVNQFDDAIRLYAQALEERPDFAEAHLNLGHAWKAKGNAENARQCWEKAFALKPELARGYFGS